jgi:hypothetical protein
VSYTLGIDVDIDSASASLRKGDTVARTLSVPLETSDPDEWTSVGQPTSFVRQLAAALRSILDTVTSSEGAPPAFISLSYPADWRPSQLDLALQAVRVAGLRVDRYLEDG